MGGSVVGGREWSRPSVGWGGEFRYFGWEV